MAKSITENQAPLQASPCRRLDRLEIFQPLSSSLKKHETESNESNLRFELSVLASFVLIIGLTASYLPSILGVPALSTRAVTEQSSKPTETKLASPTVATQNNSIAAGIKIDTLELKDVFSKSIHEFERKRSQVRFIAGLIAQFRPTIEDCGAVARDIVEISAQKGIDPFYVAAVISVESRFSATAKSHVGALGLMQLMPNTARGLTDPSEHSTLDLTDPVTNINLGIDYLIELEERFRGDRTLALAAYNWGPTNLDRVNKKQSRIPRSVRRYASKILERTSFWQRHYLNAQASAEAISPEQLHADA